MAVRKDFGKYESSSPRAICPFGFPVLVFDDALSVISEEGCCREREMTLDGKRFQIRSVFPAEPTSTPTEKLLRLIDCHAFEKKK